MTQHVQHVTRHIAELQDIKGQLSFDFMGVQRNYSTPEAKAFWASIERNTPKPNIVIWDA